MTAGDSRPTIPRSGTVSATLAVVVFIAVASAASEVRDATDVIERLGVHEWLEVPNSRMRTVCAPSAEHRCERVMSAWSGGAFDTRRDMLLIWGGGHADYWGNEVYAFDLKTLQWSRLTEPYGAARTMASADTVSTYPDGSPSSRHTYDGLEYLPAQDRLFVVGGSRWKSGTGDRYTGWFDPDSRRWERKADAPDAVLVGSAAYDPVTANVFVYSRGVLLEYDPRTDTWRTRGRDSWRQNLTAEIDPVNRKFVLIGKRMAFSYTLHARAEMRRESLGAAGASEIEASPAPGLAYDPVTRRIVAWHGGPDVYTLDLSQKRPRWDVVTAAATNRVTPTAAANNGTYGRWRYVPSRNVFVGVNSIDDNVYIYRLSPAGMRLGATRGAE